MSEQHDGEKDQESKGFAPGLLIVGVLALLVAAWALVGGPQFVGGAKLLGGLAITAVAIAGVALIVRPTKKQC
ncbi:hypothetical protein P0W64_14495 [Tsukamurella sp. 8F]|uniref:hypothetical protein n=1 Tax=unclassified Tsukamurella TaxID=2633480 RepID=UPI0023B9F9C2|nr:MULTISPECIES: hypothetical protein [unclassified Tsukamurella]MDF0532175.1 hypothetical protein [Tsukamurella sp. 8J]MDF0587986.1 hypothetical protein [Tsukamurella sp. 8F]